MSKLTIPFIQGSALAAPVGAAVAQVLAKVAPRVQLLSIKSTAPRRELEAALKESKGVALGSAFTSGDVGSFSVPLFASVSSIAHYNFAADYATAKISVVRAIASDPEPVAIRFRDRVDVFPAQGVEVEKEREALLKGFKAAALRAVDEAKIRGANKVTVVIKQVSRHEQLNGLLLQAAREVFGSAGVLFEESTTTTVFNQIVVFPESLGVVLANDVASSDSLEGIISGLTGGSGVSYKTLHGENVRIVVGGSHSLNPSGTLFAAASVLKEVGLESESKILSSGLISALQNEATRPSDLPKGKVGSASDFVKAFV